jgi:hypothetical protein
VVHNTPNTYGSEHDEVRVCRVFQKVGGAGYWRTARLQRRLRSAGDLRPSWEFQRTHGTPTVASYNGIVVCSRSYYHLRMKTLTCKIPEELDARLESVARRERTSKSAVLRAVLERRLRGESRRVRRSAYDVVKHLRGTLRGPHDLSSNPRHLKGLGA